MNMPIPKFGPQVTYSRPSENPSQAENSRPKRKKARTANTKHQVQESPQSSPTNLVSPGKPESARLGLAPIAPNGHKPQQKSSMVSTLVNAVQPGARFEVKHPRQGEWEIIPADQLNQPQATTAAKPETQSYAIGQSVTVQIGDESIAGNLAGFDYKGRPVVTDPSGARRIGSWESLRADGIQKAPETPYTGLRPDSITRPPEKLGKALEQALDIKVTGDHTAREYIDALHAKGYSVFLCGGAIRDAIYTLAQKPQVPVDEIVEQLKDVDLVTDAPPPVIRQVCEAIAPQYEGGAVWSPPMVEQFGAVLVGGPKAGLPNPEGLDVVSMRVAGMFDEQEANADTGEKAFPYTFGSSLKADATGRDFHCNTVYYDPFNHAIIDPMGRGIADAQQKFLRVSREGDQTKDDNLSLRYFKFRMRGYSTDSKNLGILRRHANASLWGPRWKVVSNIARIAPKDAQTEAQIDAFFEKLGEVMTADGCEKVFRKRVLKLKDEVTTRIQKRFKKAQETKPTEGQS